MPKSSPIQTTFSGGEFSPLVQGRTDSERYKTGLDVCLNYIPTLQGPLIRRPGTKYIADAKDPSKPPALIPFQFSASQTFMLEFGDQYIRFYTNEGEVLAGTTVFNVGGLIGKNAVLYTNLQFNALRSSPNQVSADEAIVTSSILTANSLLELTSPYAQADVANIKFCQSGDTIYLVHPNYTPYKLQRFSSVNWTLKPIIFQDGPFLPFNSYKTIGDNLRVTLIPSNTGAPTLSTGPSYQIKSTATATGGIKLGLNATHAFATGDRVCVRLVAGTVEANNNTSSVSASYWTVSVPDSSSIILVGGNFVNALVGSTGVVSPALFELLPNGAGWADASLNKIRNFSLIQSGTRYWGSIIGVFNAATAGAVMDSFLSSASETATWQMGRWNGYGFPTSVCLHQDRLALAGAANYPQEVDLSTTSNYENFAASGSSLQVVATNAMSLNLLSSESNQIIWLKSSNQGLLAGSVSNEWQIAPSSQGQALSPTNVNASPTSYYGSANVDAVQAGNATLYVQKAYRKVREMNYFFQVGTFRSTDLAELSEHITAPRVIKLAVQKEPLPLVWGVRSDGVLLSMSYNRDDQTIKAGWARHILGGQSDSAGSIPQVKSIAVITSSNAATDQLWMTVNRFVNGTSAMTIEVMTTPWDNSRPQEDGYCLDNGITYDAPVRIVGLSQFNGGVNIFSPTHGFNNGSSVLITDVVGFNYSTTDINGNIVGSNLLNGNVFIVASSTLLDFYLQDMNGNLVSGSSYSTYVSGGNARKLVSHISGLTWLKNETVGIVSDGGAQVDTVIDSSGTIALASPGAKVQIGYRYNSDGATLRSDAGAAAGSSIGMTRRIVRAAFLLYKCGDFAFGPSFQSLIPVDFTTADIDQADTATRLYSGIIRDGVESIYDLDDNLVFRQSSGLPGMVQSITIMMEEIDV